MENEYGKQEKIKVTETAAAASLELSKTLAGIDEKQVDALLEAICGAKKVYVAGAGRSLLMLRCLAMRLMHLGFESYVAGDTTTPAFEKEDLLIAGSGSGETGSLLHIAGKAGKIGGKVAVLTTRPQSSLAKLGDLVVEIPAYTDKAETGRSRPLLPGGSMFEQGMLLLGDAMVLPLAKKAGIPTDRAFARHANLE